MRGRFLVPVLCFITSSVAFCPVVQAEPIIVPRYDDAKDFLPEAKAKNTGGARLYLEAQPGETFEDVLTSRNVVVRVFSNIPAGAKAGVLLFPGGNGVMSVAADGNLGTSFNFVSRNRDMFAAAGFATFVIDAPSDRLGKAGIEGFRTEDEYGADMKEVLAAIQAKFPHKLFAAGISNGTISVSALAMQVNNALQGIVLFSPVTSGKEEMEDFDLAKLTIPVLIVAHDDDACSVSPYDDSVELKEAFEGTKPDVATVTGGGQPISGPCGPFTQHSFWGKELETVRLATDWMAAHP